MGCCLLFFFFFNFTTESRLNKLQGANKKQLTSKDILQSLGEAKDDHMLQLVDREPLTLDPWGDSWGGLGSAGRGRGGGGSGSRRRRETPSSIENEFADVDLGSREEDKGEGGGGGGDGEGEGEVERGGYRVLVGEEEGGEERPPGVWLCCLCFKGKILNLLQFMHSDRP